MALGTAGALLAGSAAAGVVSAIGQQGVANAQARAAGQQRRDALAAANSPQEIAQLEQSLALNNQDIARKEKILASTDPAIIEAGKQALNLLQGKDSSVLNPLKTTQAKQRAQLEAKLRAQLGPGYANTTAGIQALSAFDEASYNSQSAAQQNSLANLLGTSSNFSSQGLSSNIGNSQSLAGMFGNIANRNVSAINGTSLIPTAGSGQAGLLAGSTQLQSLLGQGATLAALNGMSPTGGTVGTQVLPGNYVDSNFTLPKLGAR